ncbi:hypothetical protein QPK87_37995, partial [Kamptonema cortianum]|nr:hypothetical protein [Kamptonema cortianum]
MVIEVVSPDFVAPELTDCAICWRLSRVSDFAWEADGCEAEEAAALVAGLGDGSCLEGVLVVDGLVTTLSDL